MWFCDLTQRCSGVPVKPRIKLRPVDKAVSQAGKRCSNLGVEGNRFPEDTCVFVCEVVCVRSHVFMYVCAYMSECVCDLVCMAVHMSMRVYFMGAWM